MILIDESKSRLHRFLPDFHSGFGGYRGSWVFHPKTLHAAKNCVEQAEHHVIYSKFALESAMIRNGLEEYLSSVLSSFPRIHTIVLTNTYTIDTSSFKFALQKSTIARKWVRPPQLTALFRAISRTAQSSITKISTEGRMVQKRWRDIAYNDYGLGPDPGTVEHGVPNFETDTYTKEKKPTIISSAFDMCNLDLELSQIIFSNLTHLHLALATTQKLGQFDVTRDDPPTDKCWADLPKVLTALTNIVDLSLDFKVHRQLDQQLSVYYYEDDLAELFGDSPLTMMKLKTLSLTQFRTSVTSLASLLDKNPGIKNLTLKHIINIEVPGVIDYTYYPTPYAAPGCADLLDRLRSRRLLRFDILNIEAFTSYHDDIGREHVRLLYSYIKDYVLHGYGDNPLSDENFTEEWDKELWGNTHSLRDEKFRV